MLRIMGFVTSYDRKKGNDEPLRTYLLLILFEFSSPFQWLVAGRFIYFVALLISIKHRRPQPSVSACVLAPETINYW